MLTGCYRREESWGPKGSSAVAARGLKGSTLPLSRCLPPATGKRAGVLHTHSPEREAGCNSRSMVYNDNLVLAPNSLRFLDRIDRQPLPGRKWHHVNVRRSYAAHQIEKERLRVFFDICAVRQGFEKRNQLLALFSEPRVIRQKNRAASLYSAGNSCRENVVAGQVAKNIVDARHAAKGNESSRDDCQNIAQVERLRGQGDLPQRAPGSIAARHDQRIERGALGRNAASAHFVGKPAQKSYFQSLTGATV